jgi:HK97 family phage major capsid protein
MSSRYPSLVSIARSAAVGRVSQSITAQQSTAQDELRRSFGEDVFPADLLLPYYEKRDMTAGTAGQGGNTIGRAVPEIGDSLRAGLVLESLGARIFGGLREDTGLPRAKPGLAASWLSENAVGSQVDETFSSLELTPKRVTAFLTVSLRLLNQQQNAEAFLRSELMGALGSEIQRVAIAGTGASNQPTGIINTVGVGSVVGGPNGLAPTYAHLLDLEFAVTGTAQADRGRCAWLLSPKVRKKLRSTFLNGTGSAPIWAPSDAYRLLGHPAGVTPSAPDTLTKGTSSGVASAIVFGEISELFIGFWGEAIEVGIVRDKANAIAGNVVLTASAYVDCGVRTPEAFSVMADALAA